MIRYGRSNCTHVWRFRSDGWEEGCVPAICIKCGAFGCSCDIWVESTPPRNLFFKEACESNSNLNKKWVNPYVSKIVQKRRYTMSDT